MRITAMIQLLRKGWFAKGSRHPFPGKSNEAEAIILDVHETGNKAKSRQKLKLLVQVMPESGRNFVTEVMLFKNTCLITAGLKIKVKYNPDNPREIELLGMS